MENGIIFFSSSRHATDHLNLNMWDIRIRSYVLWLISIATGVQCYLQGSYSIHVCQLQHRCWKAWAIPKRMGREWCAQEETNGLLLMLEWPDDASADRQNTGPPQLLISTEHLRENPNQSTRKRMFLKHIRLYNQKCNCLWKRKNGGTAI